MERRNTSLPNNSYNDSGVEINVLLSSASQLAPDEDHQIVVPHDVGEVEANVVFVLAVQESQYNEGDINLHPAGRRPDRIIFRAEANRIFPLCSGDVDLQAAKAQLMTFRQLLLEVAKCWTCFSNRRGVINSPCMCFCNCQECAEVMFICSLCGRRIDHAIPAVFQYVA